jgi:hypothetical protein
MKKLENIPKKDFFSPPDGYFDSLPGRVQVRLEKSTIHRSRPAFRYALQYALPMVALVAFGIFWYNQKQGEPTAETLLASVESEALVNYLAEVELSSYDELAEEVALDELDANALEQAVYDQQWEEENIDDLINEIDITNL